MARIPRPRILVALCFALLAGGSMAAPTAAATIIEGCYGTCGYWEVYDTSGGLKGAVCKYETGSYDLDFISVRPPLMHGPYSYKTKVQWRYKIYRSTNFGGTWSVYRKSTWQSAMANDAIPANVGSGFTRRVWGAPDPNPTGWFKVQIFLRWLNSGGSSIGVGVAEYDHYQGKWNGSSDYRSDYCLQDW